jgi:hypothetical protein
MYTKHKILTGISAYARIAFESTEAEILVPSNEFAVSTTVRY